jgi:tRNA 2-thiouridine synthesizing protein A
MTSGERLIVECTDPLAAVDSPHLLQETCNILDSTARDGDVLRFIIRKP